jgi:hypothetical protein
MSAREDFEKLKFYEIEQNELNENELIEFVRKTAIYNWEYITFYKDKTIELTHVTNCEVFKVINKMIEELNW